MKPLIGITCNYDYQDTVGIASGMGIVGQDWNYVTGDYVYALEKAGAAVALIPRVTNFEDVKPLLDKLDGVLVSGGHDVGPMCYNETVKDYLGTVIPQRDESDLAIARYAMLERKIPTLGICRGIQVLNVACGGTLYQDIGKEGGFGHHFGSQFPRNTGWHTVDLAEGSLLAAAYGTKTVSVNSYHHQAVRNPGNGVTITAYSADGVPEGIEIAGNPFAVGVQWHPEMMYDSDEQLKIFKAFVAAAARQ